MATIPVNVITGFLGSGKTTLLRALLARPEFTNTAVVINEFGEVGLDHFLIEAGDETVVELANGCVCCTLRGDLALTLGDLLARRRDGAVPGFERIVIETTGLADPAPILQMLMNDALLAEALTLDSVIATVDAVAGGATLERHPLSRKQVAIADRLVLTKSDLVPRAPVELLARLASLNGAAGVLTVVNGEIEPRALFGGGLGRKTSGAALEAWLGSKVVSETPHHHDHGGHDEGGAIRAHVLVRDEPIRAVTLSLYLDTLAEHCGADLLRLKGLINLRESPDRPAVIHGVQHVFHPPVWLEAWPSGDRRTRLVMITNAVPGDWLELLFEMLDQEVALEEARRAQ